MKILIVSASFYPKITPRSFRTTELVKEFVRKGHQVTLCIPDNGFDYSDFCNKFPLDIVFSPALEDNKTKSARSPFHSLFGRLANRFLALFFEYPNIKLLKSLPDILNNLGHFDLLISVAVPHINHWSVNRAIRRNPGLADVWIADCGDPYMLCQTDSFKKPFYFKWVEKSWSKRVDYITIPVESAKDGYYPDFHHKIRIIPQGFDFDSVGIVDSYVPNEILTFGFAGSFIPGLRDPRPIVRFILSKNIPFRFVVYTKQRHLFEEFFPQYASSIILKDFAPRDILLAELSKMDFLLNIENGTNIQVPSKLIDYSLTGRPILSLNSNDINQIVLDQFLNRDYISAYIVDSIEEYDIKLVAGKFIKLYEECTRK